MLSDKKIITWLPRILSLAFVFFLSIFAFDVFEGNSGWQVVLALLMHLLPSLVLLAITLIAWKYRLVGAMTFFIFAALYVALIGLDRPWPWYALICGPSLIIALLYFLSWRQKK